MINVNLKGNIEIGIKNISLVSNRLDYANIIIIIFSCAF